MRNQFCSALLVMLFVNSAFASDETKKCKTNKNAAKENVATTRVLEKPPVEPVPDPIPQSVPSQVKFLADGLSEFPPNPQPGECYVRVKQAAMVEVVKEKVLVREETIRYEVEPAQFKEVTRKVLVRPETVRYEIIPEKYETRTVEVELTPEHEEFIAFETRFKEEDARHEVVPERVYWKRGVGPVNANENMTEDILCLVRELPQFKDYKKKLVEREAEVDAKKIEKTTKTVETQVLVRPARVKEIKVPAQYDTITVRELVEPAKKKKVVVPAEYMEVERQVLTGQERMVWQRVLCDTNLTRGVIQSIQSKLKDAGFDPGQESGKLSPRTCDAIKAYQNAHKLSEGAVTYEFLDHIGVKP